MVIGIIAEYNPFHSGHAHQISEVRKIFPDTEIVVAMSGSFTQRGTPAILDKWARAGAAISGGCDLVIELPFSSAVRSAQDFARGGVRLLSKIGIDALAFGAETSDLHALRKAATVDEKIFSEKLRAEMAAGISYAAATAKILAEFTGADENFFQQPNTILATEYLRALPKNIEPILIPRIGSPHNEKILRGKFSSASAIRAAVYAENPSWEKISSAVDKKILDKLKSEKKLGLVREEFLFHPIMTKLLTTSPDELRKIFGMREGLEFLLIKSARTAKNYSELLGGMVGKRYQLSRIRRLLLYFLLEVTEEIFSETADFVRILAFNGRGRLLLKKISQATDLPIITKFTKHLSRREFESRKILSPYKKILALDAAATDLREILFDRPRNFRQDFLRSPLNFSGE